ncbi:MAG: RMD1 family protein [Deltaproteobacteria bacterium]
MIHYIATGEHEQAEPQLVEHTFSVVAFVENFAIKELATAYPEAKRTSHRLRSVRPFGGQIFAYRFGTVVFHNVPLESREAELDRLRKAQPNLATSKVFCLEFVVREDPGSALSVDAGVLTVDRMDAERTRLIAMTLAQTAAMEYYERIVDELFTKTHALAMGMERSGTVGFSLRPLHRFIGRAISTRNEVLSVLHLLDRPELVDGHANLQPIYNQLQEEFELRSRYQSVQHKLGSVQNALELIVEVGRDRRLVILELTIASLILFEIAVAMFR